ncbi:hypothetical protein COLO4_02121, partial [Corchorus olitorius]
MCVDRVYGWGRRRCRCERERRGCGRSLGRGCGPRRGAAGAGAKGAVIGCGSRGSGAQRDELRDRVRVAGGTRDAEALLEPTGLQLRPADALGIPHEHLAAVEHGLFGDAIGHRQRDDRCGVEEHRLNPASLRGVGERIPRMRIRQLGVRANDHRKVVAERGTDRIPNRPGDLVGGAATVVEHDVPRHLQRLDLTETRGCQHLAQQRHLHGRGSTDPADEGDGTGHGARLRGVATERLEQAEPDLADRGIRGHGVPEPLDRDFADDGDRRGVQKFRDVGADERRADEDATVEVDDRARFADVRVGLLAGARDVCQVVVEHLHVQPALLGAGGGETDGCHLGIGERHLWHGVVVGGGDVSAPRGVVDLATLRPRGDDVAGSASLVLALVGEERTVVDVADGVQPVEAAHEERVVDIEPRPLFQPDGLEAE